MLLTTCTTCAAQFKVLPEHLNVRQGRVMCGRCRTVFNAFETLKRVEDELPVMPTPYFPTSAPASAAGSLVGASPYAQTMPPASSASSYHLPDNEFSAPAATTTGWATRDDSTGRFTPLLESSFPDANGPEPTEAVSTKTMPADTAPVGSSAVVKSPPATVASPVKTIERATEKFSALDDEPAPAPAPALTPPPAKVESGRREPTMGARDMRQLSTAAAFDPRLETRLESPLDFSSGPLSGPPLMATDPPEEVDSLYDSRDQEMPPSRRWLILCGVMVTALIAQSIFYFRNSLAEAYPQLRPTLASACAIVGCQLSWARDTAAIEVKGSELVELPSKPGRMLANATLVNRSKVTQDYPLIELRLTNNTNQIVMSRVLQPGEYVAQSVAKEQGGADKAIVDKTVLEKGIAPNAEVALTLTIEVPPKTAASGYEFLPFYP
jgi:predicted Zn finger-like uncharacterized protein